MDTPAAETKKCKRNIHAALRIDMTPMVDLGFLLIAFFIFTTTMAEPTVMKLYMPNDKDSSKMAESNVLTVLLGNNNKVYAYEGTFDNAVQENGIIATNYDEGDGIGNLIRKKQKLLQQSNKKNGKADPVLLIKPTQKCTYKNVVDALDEATINSVKKYMIVTPSAEEAQVFRE
jgi:biopolymer transport protein ExbD